VVIIVRSVHRSWRRVDAVLNDTSQLDHPLWVDVLVTGVFRNISGPSNWQVSEYICLVQFVNSIGQRKRLFARTDVLSTINFFKPRAQSFPKAVAFGPSPSIRVTWLLIVGLLTDDIWKENQLIVLEVYVRTRLLLHFPHKLDISTRMTCVTTCSWCAGGNNSSPTRSELTSSELKRFLVDLVPDVSHFLILIYQFIEYHSHLVGLAMQSATKLYWKAHQPLAVICTPGWYIYYV
jgi:hypothetical protein